MLKLRAQEMSDTIDKIRSPGGIAGTIREIWSEAKMELAALTERQQWCPVDERMPTISGRYLVARDMDPNDGQLYVDTAWYHRDTEVWMIRCNYARDITHWMPIPDLPRK